MIDWPAAWLSVYGQRAEELLDALRLHVRHGLVDVLHVEGDVLAADVRVPPEGGVLVGRAVLEELDARPVTAAHVLDVLHDRVGDGRLAGCYRAPTPAERPERQR